MENFFKELRRRNVFRVAGVYAVVGWLLAQVSVTLETAIGLPAWFDGFIVAILLIGFPIALILAWAFEMTPEGMKLTAAVPEGESIAPKTGRKLDYAIVIGLALVGVMIIADRLMPEKATTILKKDDDGAISMASIAVLPFADLSPQGDQEYFSDGIAEEILNVLVRVDALEVASRTSSFQFKGREIGVPEIAHELKVRHVLEGSVRKSGDTIRITAQLIDTKNDRHLWSQTYDKPLSAENIFSIQDEIAHAIVEALSETLGMSSAPEIAAPVITDNLTAYDLYLQARPMYEARYHLIEADALLERAVEQDPTFVKAWELRAGIYTVIDDYGGSPLGPEGNKQRALGLIKHVLTLDPDSATAIAVRANIKLQNTTDMSEVYDFAEIFSELERALASDPRNLGALNWYGLGAAAVGDLQHAEELFQTCVDYEPFYVPCVENLLGTIGMRGRDDEAYEKYIEALDRGAVKPFFSPVYVFARRGDEALFKSIANSQYAFYGFRRHDEYYEAMRNGGKHEELANDMLNFARTKTTLNETDTSMFILPIGAYDLLPFSMYIWDPVYADYRQSPQFKHYIRTAGIEKYWREAGFPQQCRPVGKDDFACN